MILSAFEGGDTRSPREVCRCGVFPAKGLPHLAAPPWPRDPPGTPTKLPDPTPGHRAWDPQTPASRSSSLAQGTQGHWLWDRWTHTPYCAALDMCQLLHLLPDACDGKPPGSRLALTQPFPFGGNSMIGNGHHLCFQENQFFQANKSNGSATAQSCHCNGRSPNTKRMQ